MQSCDFNFVYFLLSVKKTGTFSKDEEKTSDLSVCSVHNVSF